MQDDSVGSIQLELKEALDKVEGDAKSYTKRSDRLNLLNIALRAATAVLAVAAPALVTYQTQVNAFGWQLAAILLTSIAGGAVGLQAAFALGERYRRSAMTVLALNELATKTRADINSIERDTRTEAKYSKLSERLKETYAKHSRIIRQQITGEIAISREAQQTTSSDQ